MSFSTLSRLLLTSFMITTSLAIFACGEYVDPDPPKQEAEVRDASPVSVFGGDGGRQYSDSGLITRGNVHRLEPVWSYHTGEESYETETTPATMFQVTPILVDGMLYLCTPYNRIVALDPATGAEFWVHDPQIRMTGYYGAKVACRGVTFWREAAGEATDQCSARIFTATADARLIAVDAKTGELCVDFGQDGEVNLAMGVGEALWPGEIQNTSPPLMIGDKVVVGGAVGDNQHVRAPSGVVRAFDARSGALVWAQDLAPPGYDYASSGVSEAGYALGSPNVWGPMVADETLGLVYAPTGNPAPDYFRNDDRNIDYYGSSLVALSGDTGEIIWHYQFVHHDFWDYDTAAQPTLFELERGGRTIPAVAQGTKTGFVFILDRRTGVPLFPVEERAVPQETDVPLNLSPTQPFPVLPKSVAQVSFDFDGDMIWGCDEKLEGIRYHGMFTPPSTDWTLMFPGSGGASIGAVFPLIPSARCW
jgi:quinoprotein glucose dehydrogenase